MAITLSNLGQIHKDRGDLRSAIQVFQQAADIQRVSLCLNDVVESSQQQGVHERHLQREKLQQQQILLAETLSSIGLLHFEMQEYEKSFVTFQEVIPLECAVHGENSLEMAATLNSMGLVLYKLRYDELAMQSFSRCLAIRRELLGHIHESVASVLFNIATIFLESGDDENALKCYTEVLHMEKAKLGNHHPGLTHTIKQIGRVHQIRGEFNEALVLFQRALLIERVSSSTTGAESGSGVVQTLTLLGNVYLQSGDAQNVVDTYSEVVRLLRADGRSDIDSVIDNISGFNLYALSKVHPACAAVA